MKDNYQHILMYVASMGSCCQCRMFGCFPLVTETLVTFEIYTDYISNELNIDPFSGEQR